MRIYEIFLRTLYLLNSELTLSDFNDRVQSDSIIAARLPKCMILWVRGVGVISLDLFIYSIVQVNHKLFRSMNNLTLLSFPYLGQCFTNNRFLIGQMLTNYSRWWFEWYQEILPSKHFPVEKFPQLNPLLLIYSYL